MLSFIQDLFSNNQNTSSSTMMEENMTDLTSSPHPPHTKKEELFTSSESIKEETNSRSILIYDHDCKYATTSILDTIPFGSESLTFSKDNKYLASGEDRGWWDRKLSIIDMNTNLIVKEYKFDDDVRVVAYSPDNQYLVVAAGINVYFIDVTTIHKQSDNDQEEPPEIIEMNDNIWTLSFSTSGDLLFIGGEGFYSILYKIVKKKDVDNRKFEILHKQDDLLDNAFVLSSSFSSTNNNLVAYSCNKVVHIYNIETKKILQTYHQQNATINAISFSPCDQYLSIGGDEKNLQVYHLPTSSLLCEHKHQEPICTICYSLANHVIIVGDKGGNVTFYDSANPQQVKYKMIMNGPIKAIAAQEQSSSTTNQQQSSIIAIAISTPSKTFIYDMTAMLLRNAIIDEFFDSEQKEIIAVTYSSNGNEIAYGGYGKTLNIVDTRTSRLIFNVNLNSEIWVISYSIDGNMLACGTEDGNVYIYSGCKDRKYNENKFITSSTNEELKLENRFIGGDAVGISAIKFSKDGKFLAIGSFDEKVKLYALPSLVKMYTFELESIVTSIDFNSNENVVAIGTYDPYDDDQGKVSVYNLLASKEDYNEKEDSDSLLVYEYFHDGERVDAVEYSPNDKFIAFGGEGSNNVYIGRCEDNMLVGKVESQNTGDDGILSLQFSPDSKILAIGTANGIVQLVRVEDDVKEVVGEDNNDVVDHNAMITSGGKKMHTNLSSDDLPVKEVLLWQQQFCMPIYFSPDEQIYDIGFHPSYSVKDNEEVLVDADGKDSSIYYIAIAHGKTITEMTIHPFSSTTPIDYLIDKYNDDQILKMIKNEENNLFLNNYHNDNDSENKNTRKTIFTVAMERGRTALVHSMLKKYPTQGTAALLSEGATRTAPPPKITSNHKQYQNRTLKQMVERYLAEDMKIIMTNLSATTPESVLQDLHLLLLDLAKRDLTSVAYKLLNAKIKLGEEYKDVDCPEGIIICDTIYALKPPKRSLLSTLTSSFFRKKNHSQREERGALHKPWLTHQANEQQMVPISKIQKSQGSSDMIFVQHEKRNDLERDPMKRVELYILRVFLPDLGSFECLRTLTTMKECEQLFQSKALHYVLDVLWNDFARTWFRLQFVIYLIMLLSFTVFCEMTQYRRSIDVLLNQDLLHSDTIEGWWVTSSSYQSVEIMLATFVFCGLAFFSYIEVMQMIKLTLKDYFGKSSSWNHIQLMSIIMVLISLILHLMVTSVSEMVLAFVSATALFLLWFGFLSYLRGGFSASKFAWIIKALGIIIFEMRQFLFVVFLFIVAFAVTLRALSTRDPDDLVIITGEGKEYRPYLFISAPFGNLLMSTLTTLQAALGGQFNLDELEQKSTSFFIASLLLMIVMLVIVSITVLNALIAFISDRFEFVSNKSDVLVKLEKAQLIVDTMCLFNKETLRRIEAKHRWITVVVPAASLTDGRDEVSDPSLEYIKKSTKDSNNIKKKVDKVEGEVGMVKNEVTTLGKRIENMEGKVKNLEKDVKQIIELLLEMKGQERKD